MPISQATPRLRLQNYLRRPTATIGSEPTPTTDLKQLRLFLGDNPVGTIELRLQWQLRQPATRTWNPHPPQRPQIRLPPDQVGIKPSLAPKNVLGAVSLICFVGWIHSPAFTGCKTNSAGTSGSARHSPDPSIAPPISPETDPRSAAHRAACQPPTTWRLFAGVSRPAVGASERQ